MVSITAQWRSAEGGCRIYLPHKHALGVASWALDLPCSAEYHRFNLRHACWILSLNLYASLTNNNSCTQHYYIVFLALGYPPCLWPSSHFRIHCISNVGGSDNVMISSLLVLTRAVVLTVATHDKCGFLPIARALTIIFPFPWWSPLIASLLHRHTTRGLVPPCHCGALFRCRGRYKKNCNWLSISKAEVSYPFVDA
jgi:hypothetical protein